MNELGILVSGALALSVLVGTIEVAHISKASIGGAWRQGHFFFYLAVLAVGNFVTTIACSLVIPGQFPKQPVEVQAVLASIVGVFGFQTVLKNLNVSVAGKGVFAFEQWTMKARDNAVAAAIKGDADHAEEQIVAVAQKLKDHPNLNVLIANVFGEGSVAKLDQRAEKEKSNLGLYKAYAAASKDLARCEAFAKVPR